MTNCHPDCGPITVRVDGRHAHENEDGRCWHDDDDIATLDLVALKTPDDPGMQLFAVVEGDAFRIESLASPFRLSDAYPFSDSPSDLDRERVVEDYGREWVVLWARDEEDALERAAKYDQGSYHLSALVNL